MLPKAIHKFTVALRCAQRPVNYFPLLRLELGILARWWRDERKREGL